MANNIPQTVVDAVPAVEAIVSDVQAAQSAGKPWWQSKTLWANIGSLAILVFQIKFGFLFDPAYQALGLTVINMILRYFSTQKITF